MSSYVLSLIQCFLQSKVIQLRTTQDYNEFSAIKMCKQLLALVQIIVRKKFTRPNL